MDTLSYINDDHRRYGATGMAIGLVVFDGESMLSAVTLDGAPGKMVEMTDDFFFSGNPSLSARAAWHKILSNYNITMAMAIGNTLCRSIVLERSPLGADLRRALAEKIIEEGSESCSLDRDEAEGLFNKNYRYLEQIFNHSGVQSLAHDFADLLGRRRRLSRAEVVEALIALSSL